MVVQLGSGICLTRNTSRPMGDPTSVRKSAIMTFPSRRGIRGCNIEFQGTYASPSSRRDRRCELIPTEQLDADRDPTEDFVNRSEIVQRKLASYHLAVSVGALLELKSRGGRGMEWDEWKSHCVFLWMKRDLERCRLFFIRSTESGPNYQMQVVPFRRSTSTPTAARISS